MKKALNSENRIRTAERLRKALKKVFDEDFIQSKVMVGRDSLEVDYKSKSYSIYLRAKVK